MRKSIMILGLLTGGSSAAILAAAPVQAQAAPARRSYDIPSQRLDLALNSFAEQSRLQIMFDPALVRGRRSAALKGNFSPADGLKKLLGGSGLIATAGAGGVYMVKAAQSGESTQGDVAPDRREVVAGSAAVETDSADIVVTAQKREERLFDVPIAVTAITGEEIEEKGYGNLAAMLQRAPGVSVSGSFVQIRGVSSIFGAATVGYYLDELPFSFLLSTQLPDVRAWDLERVEVLRGPQGTLYGANSIGGTIRILTRNPNLNAFEAKGEGSFGFIEDGGEEWEVKGAVNVPLIEDKLAIRIAGTHRDFGGFVDSPLGKDIDKSRITTLRGKIAIAPMDKLRITLSAWSYDSESDHSTSARPSRVSTNPFLNPTALDYQTYGGVVEFEGPGFDIVSSTSYLELALDSVATAFLSGIPVLSESISNADTFSQEVRLVSAGGGPLRWTTGAFYQHSKERSVSNIPGLSSGTASGSSKAWAVFGEGTYDLGSVEATVGARYFEDRRALRGTQVGFPPFPDVETKYSTFNPKFNLAWHATEDSLFYATVAKGFRSGQNQPPSSLFIASLFGVTVPVQIDPETLWSYEIGNKTNFLDGKLAIETALYYNAWKDLQVTIVAGGIIGALVNAGDAHSFGADASLVFRPTRELTFAVGGNINESTLDSTVPTAFEKGDRIPLVPKYTFNASALYVTPISHALDLFAFVELQQSGKRLLKAQGFVGESDAQSILNARIGVEGKNWGLYLTAQNLLDESGYAVPALSSTDFNTSIPQPRTLGILLRTNY